MSDTTTVSTTVYEFKTDDKIIFHLLRECTKPALLIDLIDLASDKMSDVKAISEYYEWLIERKFSRILVLAALTGRLTYCKTTHND